MTSGRDDVGASNRMVSYIPLALLVALVGYLVFGFVSGGFFTGGF
jgi:hypothetical protein